MSQLNELVKTETPFAVMQYFVKLRSSGQYETQKKYELMTYKICNKKPAIITRGLVDKKDIDFIKDNISLFDVKNYGEKGGGTIYEYMRFKSYFNVDGETPINPTKET